MATDTIQLHDLIPFAKTLGIELDAADKSEVRGRLEHASERSTGGGVMHGGALMGLADTIGALCAFLNLPPNAQTTTITSSTNFLRAVREKHVTATARPLHAGRRVIVVQTDLRDHEGKLVAQTTQTQAVLTSG